MAKIKTITQELYNNNVLLRMSDDERYFTDVLDFANIPANTGYYLIPGEITFADGSKYHAYLGISSDDGGEMFDYYIFSGSDIITQEDDLEKEFNKDDNEIFPFKYHLNYGVEGDCHVEYDQY